MDRIISWSHAPGKGLEGPTSFIQQRLCVPNFIQLGFVHTLQDGWFGFRNNSLLCRCLGRENSENCREFGRLSNPFSFSSDVQEREQLHPLFLSQILILLLSVTQLESRCADDFILQTHFKLVNQPSTTFNLTKLLLGKEWKENLQEEMGVRYPIVKGNYFSSAPAIDR